MALIDLWKSERGLVCIAALACVTVMFGIGRITSDEWASLFKWIIIIYVGGKSLTSAVETVMEPKVVEAATSAAAMNSRLRVSQLPDHRADKPPA